MRSERYGRGIHQLFFEILQGHIGLSQIRTILVALHARLQAKPALAVEAMPHNAHIQELRKAGQEWVHAGVIAFSIIYI